MHRWRSKIQKLWNGHNWVWFVAKLGGSGETRVTPKIRQLCRTVEKSQTTKQNELLHSSNNILVSRVWSLWKHLKAQRFYPQGIPVEAQRCRHWDDVRWLRTPWWLVFKCRIREPLFSVQLLQGNGVRAFERLSYNFYDPLVDSLYDKCLFPGGCMPVPDQGLHKEGDQWQQRLHWANQSVLWPWADCGVCLRDSYDCQARAEK